jgi:hypothetical protein
MIAVTVTGAEAVRAKLLALASAAPKRVGDALRDEAELTMREAKALTPVVTGTLRASGYVQKPSLSRGDVSVTMGFGGAASKYALAVHENPRAGHTYGFSPSGAAYGRRAYKGKKRIGFSRVGQWKYLEQPFLARVSGLTDRLLARIMERY